MHQPRSFDSAGLIKAGILTIPLGGVLKLLGNLGTFNSIGYGVPDGRAAAAVTTPGFFLGELVGSTFPVLISFFGVLALFAYLAPTSPRRILLAGLVCTVLGAGFTLAGLGVINYAIPALGDAYRSGHPYAMAIADSFFRWPRGAMLYPAALVPIGATFFAVAMWRSRALPRAVPVAFAFSTVLLAVPVPLHAVRLAGGAIGIVAGAWLAATVWRRLDCAEVGRGGSHLGEGETGAPRLLADRLGQISRERGLILGRDGSHLLGIGPDIPRCRRRGSRHRGGTADGLDEVLRVHPTEGQRVLPAIGRLRHLGAQPGQAVAGRDRRFGTAVHNCTEF